MELLIVRHAIAFERNAKRWPDDGERPLSPAGLERARKAAAGLKRVAPRPLRVLSSPLLRARQTAAVLTEFAGWPPATECAELSPGTPPEALLAALRGLREARIAAVGHEPGLRRLVAASLAGSAGSQALEFKKMGAALLTFQGAPRAGGARLLWLVPPKMLRAASVSARRSSARRRGPRAAGAPATPGRSSR
jgi:phosphohistidine phosphatase